jgi:16S rRNA (uracil1498-N3)-methyltransferase
MKLLLLPGDLADVRRHLLDRDNSFHILKVLRLPRGTRIDAADDAGNRFSATLAGVKAGRALLELAPKSPGAADEEAPVGAPGDAPGKRAPGEFDPGLTGSGTGAALPRGASPRIALVQGLPKGQKMDLIIRQAVEAGVELVLPLQTRYSVVRELGESNPSKGSSRRDRILKEALQQSGSIVRTRLGSASSVEDLGARLACEGFTPENSLYLMFHELDIATASLHEYCSGINDRAVILIGPEGGFSQEETQGFLELGFKAVHIPGSILRTETAALFAIAAVKTVMLEKNIWTLSK